jgi:hypothetical protein
MLCGAAADALGLGLGLKAGREVVVGWRGKGFV